MSSVVDFQKLLVTGIRNTILAISKYEMLTLKNHADKNSLNM